MLRVSQLVKNWLFEVAATLSYDPKASVFDELEMNQLEPLKNQMFSCFLVSLVLMIYSGNVHIPTSHERD